MTASSSRRPHARSSVPTFVGRSVLWGRVTPVNPYTYRSDSAWLCGKEPAGVRTWNPHMCRRSSHPRRHAVILSGSAADGRRRRRAWNARRTSRRGLRRARTPTRLPSSRRSSRALSEKRGEARTPPRRGAAPAGGRGARGSSPPKGGRGPPRRRREQLWGRVAVPAFCGHVGRGGVRVVRDAGRERGPREPDCRHRCRDNRDTSCVDKPRFAAYWATTPAVLRSQAAPASWQLAGAGTTATSRQRSGAGMSGRAAPGDEIVHRPGPDLAALCVTPRELAHRATRSRAAAPLTKPPRCATLFAGRWHLPLKGDASPLCR